jgi:hypothetical protein
MRFRYVFIFGGSAGLVVDVAVHHQCGSYDVSSPLARIKFPATVEAAQ